MSERNLLASAIRSREAYQTLHAHLDTGILTAQGKVIWEALEEYYQRDPDADSCSSDLLVRAVQRKVSNPKHKESFGKLVENISSYVVSPANVIADYVAVNQEAVGIKLASALANTNKEVVDQLIEEYRSWDNPDLEDDGGVTITQGIDFQELFEKDLAQGDLIKLYPKSLNDRIAGGCLRGHHVVLFARPEAGKTAFLVNAMFGFLQQGLTVVYAGNEDPIASVKSRLVSRCVNLTRLECAANWQAAKEKADKQGYDKMYWADLTPGSPRQLDWICNKMKPDVLVIDQLRNLHSREDGFTQQLENVAREVRTIGKRHNCLIVSVTQAGGSAENKSILDMTDVDSSKTGIPAQADLMIGLGYDEADEAAGRRTLSLVKNKLSGQHDFFHVGLDTDYSRFSSMG